jgi:hypothetical protein
MTTAMNVLLLAIVLTIVVVLPAFAFWRARQMPPARDERFVQRSDKPMPDRSYLGQGRS